MSNLLLDYAFKVSTITPAAAASTGFLKKLCIVVKPKSMVSPGTITACTTQTQIAAITDNLEAQQALSAGMSSVYILPMDDLNLAEALEGHDTDFYSLVISSDFDNENEDTQATGTVTITSYANLVASGDDTINVGGVVFTAQTGAATLGTATFRAATSNDATASSLAAQINAHASLSNVEATVVGAVVTITAVAPGEAGNEIVLAYSDMGTATIGATVSGAHLSGGEALLDVGDFGGVVGLWSSNTTTAATHAAVENRVGFYSSGSNKAKNLIYAFGKLLSNALNWRNQQYVTMPLNDGVSTLGDAESLFDDKVSFVISDADYGNRLALFACGGAAIVAPYIRRNLEIDLQSAALIFISANQPAYTKTNATLLESALNDTVQSYVTRGWIEAGTVSVDLLEDNFVASSSINIAPPNALWRVFAEMQQTL